MAGTPLRYDILDPACPSRSVLRHVTDRWTPLIVAALAGGGLRFGELRTAVGGVTAKVLTQTLRSMERDGLVARTVTATSPPKVEYALTPAGHSLSAPMEALRRWAQDHADAILAARDGWDEAASPAGVAAEVAQ